ncbi:unnamed protein product [Adineta ricciae]|uniref:Innexin n=1 Tax=Adineta ricciae TaxID=249248 RepID=A0A813U2V5_ADIRI|nr:unnamed protein product [Adineta ricciae]
MDHHLYMFTFCITIFFRSQSSDDDDIDRLNRKFTVYLLLALSVIAGSRLFSNNISSLISCWNRANFPSAYITYTNYICFTTHVYRLDFNESIPNSINDRKARVLNYYQWTPFIILLMALFFYLPRLFWRSLSVRSGIDLLDIIEAAGETRTVKDFDDRDELIKYIVDTIDMYVDDARRQVYAEKRQASLIKKFFQLCCCTTGKFLGNYFITLYIFIKIYYILNVILQIWLLGLFLGTNFLKFGFESVKLFRYGLNQPESQYFPRETFCDFHVREPLRGGEPLQRITVQCVLTVNLFNQQIFTLLWIWYVFVLICNVCALVSWSVRLASSSRQFDFIHSRLARTSRPEIPRFRFKYKYVTPEVGDHVQRKLVEAFLNDYLEADGYFFIRLLAANASDFIVQEVLEQLWSTYVKKYGEADAFRAQEEYFAFRGGTLRGAPMTQLSAPANCSEAAPDSRLKYDRQHSELRMNDRDDFAELVGSARSVTKCSSFHFNGRIRYGTKGEKVEERLLCMDTVKVYICSVKTPVKIESQFNILSIKLIEHISDSQVLIEADEKQIHTLYGLHDKSSLQPFLIVLIRNLHAVFPHRLQSIVEIRPENEYEKLLRLSNDYCQDVNIMSTELCPCGGFSLRYECACDFYQLPCNRTVQNIVDTVFAHRISREFTFREFEALTQKDWLPIISALRYNEWFTKITIENVKLTSENLEELCTVIRLCKTIRSLSLINCGLRHDFCTRLAHALPVTHVENIDLSNNAIEDKGLIALSSTLQQRKLPLVSINLQSCSITHKGLHAFNAALVANNNLMKTLQTFNLFGNRIKEDNCLTLLFQNSDNVLEDLYLSDLEFSLESFLYILGTASCKLRRLYITSAKSTVSSSFTGGVKLFFAKNQTLEVIQISNANLSNEFLRELCDGLHSNVHLNKLDLRLCGNQLETFIHDYAVRFATIPSLTTLDISGCDIDNEIPTLLSELKKNRKLKSLYMGKNFNNIKQRNMQRTINAMKDLVIESDLECFSIADSKLKENTIDLLSILIQNVSLKVLDIRGNLMGDQGARLLTHILQMNRHLHTILFDRNQLSLANFEDIVNSMDENYTIQYLPIPITDIILMKITEKDRMEKVQSLMNKLDSICTRNQQQKENFTAENSLLLTTAANLTREIHLAWENQQQLIGNQASLDYVLSCSNRLNNHNHPTTINSDLNSILTRTANISKISAQLYEEYVKEEEQLRGEWNEMCKVFKQKFAEKNERLSRKFYQLFKEQTTINYDDKLQEQIRTYFAHSNDNIDQLLTREISNRVMKCSRECYINVSTCLQKRAYDTTNETISDMQKQMETDMFRTNALQHGTLIMDAQPHTPTSTLERVVNRGNHVVQRLAHRHNQPQIEATDDTSSNRQIKPTESNECLRDPSPKSNRAVARVPNEPEHRIPAAIQNNKGPVPTSPKPATPAWRKSMLVNTADPETMSTVSETIYGNVHISQRLKTNESSIEDEGDLIEHDLLDIVKEEEQKEQMKDTPPALPVKKRTATTASNGQENNLDVDIESTPKLVHPGKDRPRRANVRRPIKRSLNGANNDNSSDGGLLTDDNDDTSVTDLPIQSPNEVTITVPDSTQTNESTSTIAKILKPVIKTSKNPNDELTTSTINKTPVPQPRPSAINPMSKSMTVVNNDAAQIVSSDLSNSSSPGKPSMSTSLYSPVISSTNAEHKEITHSTESIPSPVPPVSARTGRIALGARVLPVLDPSSTDAPPVKLRHFQSERRPIAGVISSLPETTHASDTNSGNIVDVPTVPSSSLSTSHTDEQTEQYKRLPVKERARMLSTTLTPMTPTDKKTLTSTNTTTISSSSTPPYTPRTYRRLIEQVNLFC